MAHDRIRFMRVFFLPAAEKFTQVGWRPGMDVYRTREGWLVKFELAGVKPEDISVTVQGRRLSVRGVRRDCTGQEEYCCHRMDIAYGRFERSVELPFEVESAPVSTDYRDGMLVVRIGTKGGTR